MEKEKLGKKISVFPTLTIGHRELFDQMGLISFLLAYHTLVYIKLQLSIMKALIQAGPLSQYFYLIKDSAEGFS